MLALYRLLTLLLSPLALIRLERGVAAAAERGRWRERLGRVPATRPGHIWLHAASVGEINAAQALIRALLDRAEPILVSTMTRSGAARCRELFGSEVEHRYLPLDNPLAVSAWLQRIRPRAALILETEIWPELYHRCEQLDIPLLLINARVSETAFRRYQRFQRLVAGALATVELALCQSANDAGRLAQLGLPGARARISGNLKFDLPLPADLKARAAALQQRWGGRPTWVAGSTRPGEEALLIEAHISLRRTVADALLVLAPRHPERVDTVASLLNASGLGWCRLDQSPTAISAVVLVDRLGVLLESYAAGDAAFVGGSLVPLGGHNLLEPAALAKPIIAGPHLEQQAGAAQALTETGGLIVVDNPTDLATTLGELLSDPHSQRQRGQAARAAVQSGSGSLQTTLDALEPWLALGRPDQ